LERLRWEIDQFRFRQRAMAPGEVRADGPSTVAQHVTSSPASEPPSPPATPAPPGDSFRAAVSPSYSWESSDELRAEIADRKRRLARCNLSETSAQRLAGELADARGEAAQLAVLDHWLDRMKRSAAMTETVVNHYVDLAEARADRPLDGWRPSLIAPWINRR
jgi:hypothetical protein